LAVGVWIGVLEARKKGGEYVGSKGVEGGGGGMHKSECNILQFSPHSQASIFFLFSFFSPRVLLFILRFSSFSFLFEMFFHGTSHLCTLSKRLGNQCIINQWGWTTLEGYVKKCNDLRGFI
jgi:hypothetical protein